MPNIVDRQTSILYTLDDFHYAYGSQLQRLYFTNGSPVAMARARNRLLASMTTKGLLYRYPREPLPGNKHGSTEHKYMLARGGQMVVNELRAIERPPRSIDRTTSHFLHALAVTELHVRLSEDNANGSIQLLASLPEPACHIHYRPGRILKPDYYAKVRVRINQKLLEYQWFTEVERSRQSERATLAKLHAYLDYMHHLGVDQIMPRVLFICYIEVHRAHMHRLLDRNTGQDRDVFLTTLPDNAIKLMEGHYSE